MSHVFFHRQTGTIGHPLFCLGPFSWLTIEGTLDLFTNDTCTSGASTSQENIWDIGYGAYCVLSLLIVIPAVIRVSVNLHKDVKFELEWKEQDALERGVAIENAMEGQDSQYIFGQNGPELSVRNENVDIPNQPVPQLMESVPSAQEVEFNENAGDIPVTASERDFNNDVFGASNQENESPPPNLRQNTEEQLRMVMAASILSAQQEEEKRMQKVTTESQQDAGNGGVPPSVMRSGSVSMTGFWAKGKGLSSAALATMFSQSDNECIVCYEDYEIGQMLARLKCGHQLHKKCAREWLAENPTCPICRVNVLRPAL